jgi:energy-coupling factor transport system permease/ATP-binding protein
MIELKNVNVSFDSRHIIYDTNFLFEKGLYYLLRGNTGSGKTTLLKLIAGLLKANSGVVLYSLDGQVSATTPPRIGYISQEPQLQLFFPSLSDELSFGMLNLQVKKDIIESRLTFWLDTLKTKFGIDVNKSIYALSGGQQQIVSLAAAFAIEPQILLLDEPTSMLDDDNTLLVREFLEFYRSQHPDTIIIHSTHEPSVAPIKPSHTLFLKNGKLAIRDESLVNTSVIFSQNATLNSDNYFSTSNNDPYLIAKKIGYQFKGYPFLFRNISFEVRSGDLIVVYGKNGSGKSTLIDLLWRWVKPTEGEVITKKELNIGVVLQNSSDTFIWEYVRDEFIKTYPDYLWTSESLSKHLFECGVSSLIDRPTKMLSGGEKRLLSIALAAVEQPDLLILDEPFLGLDNEKKQELLNLIAKWRLKGKAIIYTANRKVDIIAESSKYINLDRDSTDMKSSTAAKSI